MGIAAGRLRHRVEIQSLSITTDPATGDPSKSWGTVATVWAAVEPASGRELVAAAAVQSKITARIIIRYRDGVTHKMRALHRGKIYNIEAVLADKDSGLEYLTLHCSEGVSDGV